MLYLELGLITPFKEIIMKKRLLFLHYILNQDKKLQHGYKTETYKTNTVGEETTKLSRTKVKNAAKAG